MTNPRGNVIAKDGKAAIAFERRIPHPIAEVWEAITEPEDLGAWLGPAQVEGGPGGRVILEAGPHHMPLEMRRTEGRILEWDPPRLFEFEWRQKLIEHSTVRFELSPDGDGATLLKLTHRWVSVDNANGFAPGWHAFLDRLAAHMEGAEIPEWQDRYGEVASLYGGAWKR
ncbi:MAG: ATPase [Fibrobacteres bacterium]|nr:ATPase [Fibrobacterota bacterium]